MNRPRGPSRPQRALQWGAGVVAALVLGELGLQLVAWRVWSTDWIGPSGSVRAGHVLMVGAGETFDEGLLSRADAWPADVERVLRDAGRDVTISNRASPGRDSRDVLRALPLQLTLERPAVVVACVGVEDFRRRAATAVAERELRGRIAPFVWRSRLVGLIGDQLGGGPDVGLEGPPFLGRWHFGEAEFAFEADGTFWMGQVPAHWTFTDGALRVAIPGGEAFDVDWELSGDRLDLRGGFPGGRVTLDRGPALPGPAARGLASMARGAWDEAEWMLVPAVRGAARDPDAAAVLVELLARSGRRADAEASLATLASEVDGPAAVRRLARGRIALGQLEDGVSLVAGALAEHASDPVLSARLRRLPPGPAADRIAAAAEAALETAPLSARRALAWIAADLRAPTDGAGALRLALLGLAAGDADPDPADVPAVLRSAADPEVDAAAVGVSIEDRARIGARRQTLAAADRAAAAVLEQNLLRLVELVRFYGAECVLLDPADDPVASVVRARVAAATGTAHVSCASTRDSLRGALLVALPQRLPSGR